MSNFIWDDSPLNGPKSDLTPEPPGANPNQWVNAGDWNQLRQSLLDIQTVARAPAGMYDIRNYGAVSVDDTGTRGTHTAAAANSTAIESAIAAWTQQNTGPVFATGGPTGGIYIPPGNWYIERPVVPPANCLLFGDTPMSNVLVAGTATATEPTLAQGFGGPVIYMGPAINPASYPTFSAPLVGATGQTMNLVTTNPNASIYGPSLIIDECYPWGSFLTNYASQVCLRFFVKITSIINASGLAWVIGSRDQYSNGALAVYVTLNAGQVQYVAMLTTCSTTTGQPVTQKITSAPFAMGSTVHHIEIDYNGNFFDFYVDGVNQGHLAASGKVYKTGMEQASIGDNQAIAAGNILQANGGIFSVELADIARHTGTGSFTPPASAHTADADTLWLFNGDQPAPTAQQPFIRAQTAVLNIANPGSSFFLPAGLGQAKGQLPHSFPAPHYMRLEGYFSGTNQAGMEVRNLQVMTCFNNSGITIQGCSRSRLENLVVYGASNMGVFLTDNNSFFGRAHKIWILADGCCMCYLGAASEIETHNSNIGFWGRFGAFDDIQDQPEWSSYIPFLWGPLADEFSTLHVSNSGNDEEGNFQYQKCASFFISGTRAVFENNIWDATAAPVGTPAWLAATSGSSHFRDGFANNNGSPCISTLNKAGGLGFGVIRTFDCRFPFQNIVSDIPGLVVQDNFQAKSNQNSLSVTDTTGSNLAGKFTVLHGYTSGGPTFLQPEPDANYIVNVQFQYSEGSAPAAGSLNVTGYTTRTDGFTVTLGADPGGTCLLHFSYTIIRTPSLPLYRSYIPTLPSSISNPLNIAPTNGNQAVGFTLLPVGRHTFAYNGASGNEMVVQSGTAPINQWYYQLSRQGGVAAIQRFGQPGGFPVNIESFVNTPVFSPPFSTNYKLYSPMSPGPHNIVFTATSTLVPGSLTYGLFIDGGYAADVQFAIALPNPGVEPTTTWIGEDNTGAQLLASATIRNLIIDPDWTKCITVEQDAGPQAGQTEAAFFGDNFTWGVGAATAPGGWATQIAEAKYTAVTPYYYWFAANVSQTAATTLNTFWSLWGAQHTLNAIVVMAGFNDLLNSGTSGATTWGYINQMMEGVAATATFNPPTGNSFGVGYIGGPQSGSATYTINGTVVTGTFNTSALQTVTDIANTINATPVLNTQVHATVNPGSNPVCQITSLTPGYAGNWSFTSNFANGAAIFPTGGFITGGTNGRLTITPSGGAAHVFDVIFTTDANTTTNNLITAINAVPAITAVVTPTNVSGNCLLTAVTAGSAGNNIGASANGVNGCFMTPANTLFLTGGVNGARGNIPHIVLANCPPFGDAPGFTAGKDTERGNFNTSMANYVAAHPGVGIVLADVDATVRNPANHAKILPANLASDNINLSDAGHTAVKNLINPLLP